MDIKIWSLNFVSIACWLQFAAHGSLESSDGSNRRSKSLWTPYVSPDWFQWKIKKKDHSLTIDNDTAVARDYGGDYGYAPAKVDFSPLFLALVPIALFLGAAAALALATVTTPNQAVATAQQQQQQQENQNNNNNANNNNNNLMAALMAAFASFYTNNNNYNNYPYIIIINGTGRALNKRSAYGEEPVVFENLFAN